MSFKQPAIMIAAAALCVVVGSASASAQQNCGFAYQRVMEAYQTQSPYYGRMLDHYNARCLSGSSQPTWQGDRYQGYGNDRYGYSNGYSHGRSQGAGSRAASLDDILRSANPATPRRWPVLVAD